VKMLANCLVVLTFMMLNAQVEGMTFISGVLSTTTHTFLDMRVSS
jgi:hypothetical protein